MEYITKLISFKAVSRSKKKDSYSNLSTAAAEVSTFQVDRDTLKDSLVDRGMIASLVLVPSGVDVNEWIATQTIMLFENINLLCGCLGHHCKPPQCTSMTGPNNIQYTWFADKGKKTKMAACQYIDCTTSYMHSCVLNEHIFPTKYGNTFPTNFRMVAANLHQLLCQILVHSYHAHLPHLAALQLTPHYTTILHHFLCFNRLFKLANPTDLSLFDAVFSYLESPVDDDVDDNCDNNDNSDNDNNNDDDKFNENCDKALLRDVHITSANTSAHPTTTSAHPTTTSHHPTTTQQHKDSSLKDDDQDIPVNNYVPLFTIVT